MVTQVNRRPKLARSEAQFARSLRQIARHVGRMIEGFPAIDHTLVPTIQQIMQAYANALVPWATKTVSAMLLDVNARDIRSWQSLSHAMSVQTRQDLRSAEMLPAMRALLAEQVKLIQSIPMEAAKRVHRLTQEALIDSTRANEIAAEIQRTTEVTESRAVLIARTEVGRASTTLTMARATQAGNTHYVWKTAGDQDVRPGHKAMEGKVCSWADPPAVVENGKVMHFHPGCIWNCRCWPMPIINED